MVKKLVDLHLHSHCSDGLYPPAEVIRRAARAGLAAAALADHDNVDGTDEALQAGREYGIEVLPAVELSVVWESFRDIHLLGYAIDHRHPALQEALRTFRAYRSGRNAEIVERINARLVAEGRTPIAFAAIQARAEGTLGRPHIAMELVERGLARNHDDAFVRYLVPCNVPKYCFPMADAIDLIHAAGGVTSLAHPPYITEDRRRLRQLFDLFAGMGLDAIEAYSNRCSNADIDWYITEARRRDLIITGGSDYHGVEGGDVVIGGGRGNLRIPYRCVEDIHRVASRRKAGGLS